MARPWCDIDDDVKPWIGIDQAVTEHDAVLTIIRDSVEQSVANYCEHEFEEKEAVELLDGTMSDVITPENWPIVSVESMYFNTNIDGTGGNLVDATSYDVRDYGVVLGNSVMTPRGRGRIKLEYTWGFDGLPPDVKLAVLQAIEAEFRRKGRKSIGIGSRSKKDESERFTSDASAWDMKTGLPKEVIGKLNAYRQGPEFTTQPMATRNL